MRGKYIPFSHLQSRTRQKTKRKYYIQQTLTRFEQIFKVIIPEIYPVVPYHPFLRSNFLSLSLFSFNQIFYINNETFEIFSQIIIVIIIINFSERSYQLFRKREGVGLQL
jgi:hypothetical protein